MSKKICQIAAEVLGNWEAVVAKSSQEGAKLRRSLSESSMEVFEPFRTNMRRGQKGVSDINAKLYDARSNAVKILSNIPTDFLEFKKECSRQFGSTIFQLHSMDSEGDLIIVDSQLSYETAVRSKVVKQESFVRFQVTTAHTLTNRHCFI